MRDADVRKLDLPILMMFESLLRTRSTVQTAQEVGVTQSAISHALAKLRQIFADPLFVRGQDGLDATERALALAPLIHEVLEILRSAVRQNKFDAATATAIVRIAIAEHALDLASPLVRKISLEAPKLTIRFSPVRANFADALASREIDLAIGPSANDRRLATKALWVDSSCALVRHNHPLTTARNALRVYRSASHVICNDEGAGATKAARDAIGQSERVVAETHSHFATFAMAARSDLVATAPRRLAGAYAHAFGLSVVDLPGAYTVDVSLSARSLADRDPMQDWLTEAISEVASEI